MHSRIMGILTKENYNKLTEENGGSIPMPDFTVFDSLPGWADYVNDDVDFQDDFAWLCEYLNNDYFEYNPETHVIKFQKGYKEEFFKKRFNLLKEIINKENALEVFCSPTESWEMRTCIRDETGFLITDDYGSWDYLDEFIRYLETDVEYVVFGSLDYHW